jgi:hypothetical protein
MAVSQTKIQMIIEPFKNKKICATPELFFPIGQHIKIAIIADYLINLSYISGVKNLVNPRNR